MRVYPRENPTLDPRPYRCFPLMPHGSPSIDPQEGQEVGGIDDPKYSARYWVQGNIRSMARRD